MIKVRVVKSSRNEVRINLEKPEAIIYADSEEKIRKGYERLRMAGLEFAGQGYEVPEKAL